MGSALTLDDVKAAMSKLGLTGPDWTPIDVFDEYGLRNDVNNAQEMEQAQAMQAQRSLVEQAGQLASAPMADPSKNPDAMEQAGRLFGVDFGPEGDPEDPPIDE